jgi:hypothetical protein
VSSVPLLFVECRRFRIGSKTNILKTAPILNGYNLHAKVVLDPIELTSRALSEYLAV